MRPRDRWYQAAKQNLLNFESTGHLRGQWGITRGNYLRLAKLSNESQANNDGLRFLPTC